MTRKFDGIAFDFDGTLYANHRFYVRIVPFLLRHWPFIAAWGRARNAMRKNIIETYSSEGFYENQARLMAGYLGNDAKAVQEKLDRLVYRGWEEIFGVIPLFPHAKEAVEAFHAAGFKMGILSDVPPDRKLDLMGLGGLWDVKLCSENCGGLKPAHAPFLALAEKMGLPPERILYVGNSVPYDIKGSKNVGMKAALLAPMIPRNLKKAGHSGGRREGYADFVFSSYRQLSAFVLG
jgi:putative hydrolase of the HAD superfamily